ncbi:MAG: YybH family protein, partial [Alphaproteobacteria bacterium]
MVAAAMLAAGFAGQARADDFDNMVAAERAFAADAAARNVRDAFLTALAEDGVVFAPGPVDAHRHWTPRPVTAAKLEWAPEAAEIAASGDLGYTYGPWRFTPPDGDKPLAFGHYFTIWRKQADGTWRVLADKGITHDEQAVPAKVVRRGQVAVAGAPAPGVSAPLLDELRLADLLPVGRVTETLVAADFMRFRTGELPRAITEAPALEPGPA